MQNHVLLVSEDEGTTQALQCAREKLANGSHLTWICSTATSAKLDAIEEIAELKNVYLATLNLLVITREESQPFDVLTGALDTNRLAFFADLLFDCASVNECVIAITAPLAEVTSDWARASLPTATVNSLKLATTESTNNITTADDPDAVSVKVILQGREVQFNMQRTAGTLLDGAEDSGIDLPFSCRGGVCSTCRAQLREGEVALMENYALEDWELEAGFTLPCQAEPISSKITLDYDKV